MAPLQRVAAGLRILPTRTAQPFAAAQAAWRFYANPRVTLPRLAEPLIDAARHAVPVDCQDYALVIHDWSDLDYRHHDSKADRYDTSAKGGPGYELMTALVVSDRDGRRSPRCPSSCGAPRASTAAARRGGCRSPRRWIASTR